jgi:hypothetical protein
VWWLTTCLFVLSLQLLKEYLERALEMLVDTTTTDAVFDAQASTQRPANPGNQDGGDSSSAAGDSSPQPLSMSSHHNAAVLSALSAGANSLLTPSLNQSAAALTPSVHVPPVEGTRMSLLLRPPAIPLNIESTCMALNERIVAAESCCFIAMVSM